MTRWPTNCIRHTECAIRRGTRSVPATVAVLGILWLCPVPVRAHTLHVFAHVQGKTFITGKAYFGGGTAAQGVPVVALDPAGKELGRTTTDAQGQFSLEARDRCDHKLVVATDDGHGAEYTIHAAELAAAPGDDRAALGEQIVLLRDQLDQYQQRLSLRDLLGGIGYILGITGVACYFLAAKRSRHG